jgi:hypothetical protein
VRNPNQTKKMNNMVYGNIIDDIAIAIVALSTWR